jgi:hypothetical protein
VNTTKAHHGPGWMDPRRRGAPDPPPIDTHGERALISTLLEQGIHILRTCRYPELPAEVAFFFGPSSFETFANLLGLDPDAVRDRLVAIFERRLEKAVDPRIRTLFEEAIAKYRG